MNTLLILGTNIDSNYCYISAYDSTEHKYIQIKHDKKRTLKTESRMWNIFSWIKCELVEGNYFYKIKEGPIFVEQLNGKKGKRYLRSIDKSLDRFLSPHNRENMGMFFIDSIQDISKTSKGIEVVLSSRSKKYKYTIRDTKFLAYLIGEHREFIENKYRALDYINRKESDIYILLYKPYKNQLPYILGIHSL